MITEEKYLEAVKVVVDYESKRIEKNIVKLDMKKKELLNILVRIFKQFK